LPVNRFHFVVSHALHASGFFQQLTERYGHCSPETADVIVVWGGDGLMLESMHTFLSLNKPFYGVHCGTVGFLMNAPPRDLLVQLHKAEPTLMRPLKMSVETVAGDRVDAPAINEIYLCRNTSQAAKIQISVNDVVRMEEVICDGILAATPAGSTAYNLSAGGPVLPLGTPLIALTPICPFRPRRWRGAILPDDVRMTWTAMETQKRPVTAVADHLEVPNAWKVEIQQDAHHTLSVLFDPHHNLEARILNEQFAS
jgi:NAD+ kinase